MEELVAAKIEELVANKMVADKIEVLAADQMEELVAGLEEAGLGNSLDEEADFSIRMRKKSAAMRKEQKKSTEGGWMRCASCPRCWPRPR